MTVITRFAPSPTGFLHIGSARTALFNWLFSRHHNGKFLLRIEDTDRERSTKPAIDAIISGLKWLGLNWDDEVIFQFSRAARHAEVAHELVRKGQAYYCYTTAEELAEMRKIAEQEKRIFKYDGRWRDRDSKDAPANIKPAIRLKAPQTGQTSINDKTQGLVTINNDQLDDMILLRSDGTPTYMLAVVVDDHDMNITNIIRGDDHFTNSFRQKQIYDAMGWQTPEFCHIPLIHGSDGAKLSKRHGALGVNAYEEMGFLPEAICNYLLRLGWSHGNDEIIPQKQAIEWFNLEDIGKSPSRFDLNKLTNLNGHYIRECENQHLLDLITPAIEKTLNKTLSIESKSILLNGITGLKTRAKTLNELAEQSIFYATPPSQFSEKAKNILTEQHSLLEKLQTELSAINDWSQENLEQTARQLAEKLSVKLGDIGGAIRAALTGSHISPSSFEIMSILGKNETLSRIKNALLS